MSFIGIDLGTSFIKGAVLDLERRQLGYLQRIPFPDPLTGQGPLFCEFDPDEVVTAVHKLINDLASKAPDYEGLVMCSQMHGMVLLDERGETRSNCITWRDQRVMMPHPGGGEVTLTSSGSESVPSGRGSSETSSIRAGHSAFSSGSRSRESSPPA